MKEFHHKFRDGTYACFETRLLGVTDTPGIEPGGVLIVQKGLHGLEHLDTWIHEMLHASLNDLPEEVVGRVATDIAEVLFKRLGYRRKT